MMKECGNPVFGIVHNLRLVTAAHNQQVVQGDFLRYSEGCSGNSSGKISTIFSSSDKIPSCSAKPIAVAVNDLLNEYSGWRNFSSYGFHQPFAAHCPWRITIKLCSSICIFLHYIHHLLDSFQFFFDSVEKILCVEENSLWSWPRSRASTDFGSLLA